MDRDCWVVGDGRSLVAMCNKIWRLGLDSQMICDQLPTPISRELRFATNGRELIILLPRYRLAVYPYLEVPNVKRWLSQHKPVRGNLTCLECHEYPLTLIWVYFLASTELEDVLALVNINMNCTYSSLSIVILSVSHDWHFQVPEGPKFRH